jgi:hypothetical protein
MIKCLGRNSRLREGEDEPASEVILARIKFIGTEWNFIPSICADDDVDPVIRHFAGYSYEVRQREIPRQALAACYRTLSESQHGRRRFLDHLRHMWRRIKRVGAASYFTICAKAFLANLWLNHRGLRDYKRSKALNL